MRKRTYTVNDNFFKTPNLLNSYWAGFIAADGCVRQDKSSSWLEISIHKNDLNHLKQFCHDINFTGKIRFYENICRIAIYSHDIVRDLLNNFNIVPKKSLILTPPNLFNDLAKAYIIGYIDGDGCISIKDGKYINLNLIGTYSVLTWMKNIFEKITKFPNKNGISQVRLLKDKNSSLSGNQLTNTYAIAGHHALFVLRTLNSYNVPKMFRKWNKLNNNFVFKRKINSKKSHCGNSHLYTKETTTLTKKGFRRCLLCSRITDKNRNRVAKNKREVIIERVFNE